MNRTIQAAARMAVYMTLLGAIVLLPHLIAYTFFPA